MLRLFFQGFNCNWKTQNLYMDSYGAISLFHWADKRSEDDSPSDNCNCKLLLWTQNTQPKIFFNAMYMK